MEKIEYKICDTCHVRRNVKEAPECPVCKVSGLTLAPKSEPKPEKRLPRSDNAAYMREYRRMKGERWRAYHRAWMYRKRHGLPTKGVIHREDFGYTEAS